jgi:hypothetical protein
MCELIPKSFIARKQHAFVKCLKMSINKGTFLSRPKNKLSKPLFLLPLLQNWVVKYIELENSMNYKNLKGFLERESL